MAAEPNSLLRGRLLPAITPLSRPAGTGAVCTVHRLHTVCITTVASVVCTVQGRRRTCSSRVALIGAELSLTGPELLLSRLNRPKAQLIHPGFLTRFRVVYETPWIALVSRSHPESLRVIQSLSESSRVSRSHPVSLGVIQSLGVIPRLSRVPWSILTRPGSSGRS